MLGIPVGSELAISYAGVLASGQIITGQHHHLQLIAVIAVATAGEITGSLVGYGLGRFGGRALIDRIGKYALLTHKDLDRAEAWFARSGDTVVFFARFIPLIRSFISIAAGIGEMTLRWFLAFSFAACLLWCSALAIIGYALGSTWHRIVTTFSYIGYVAAALAICAVALLIAHRLRALRAEHALHPAQNS